jgi:hypothetical protein
MSTAKMVRFPGARSRQVNVFSFMAPVEEPGHEGNDLEMLPPHFSFPFDSKKLSRAKRIWKPRRKKDKLHTGSPQAALRLAPHPSPKELITSLFRTIEKNIAIRPHILTQTDISGTFMPQESLLYSIF